MGLDVQAILRNTGRWCVNPTDLSLVFPHGGTALGYVHDAALLPGIRHKNVTAEEYGGETVAVVYTGASWTGSVMVRQWWDNTTLAAVFPATLNATGTGQTRTGVQYPGTVRAGTLLEADNFSLLFSPTDRDNPAFYIKSAVALLTTNARIPLTLDRDMEYEVIIYAMRPATGQAVQLAPLPDITL